MPLFAVVDVETTGGSYQNARLTEIAVYLFDGKHILKEFTSLINPEQPIPYMITRLTGITDDMVANAPKFYQVAKQIVEITEGAIFVGHNVAFDYNFVRHEFKSLGYNFKRSTMCTVKMSRKVFPGFSSYSLGKLCNSLGIEINDRHRAHGDALATTYLLKRLLDTDEGYVGNQVQEIPEILKNVPEDTGVYYLHDENGNIIYVGKSNNMYERIMQHFRNQDTSKALEMKNRIATVSYEVTGSELIALLLESDEIKKLRPPYNRAQRRVRYGYSVFSFVNEDGYICFTPGHEVNGYTPIASFPSLTNAQNFLYSLLEKHKLCQKLCGLYETQSACFYHTIKECKGACLKIESPESYNKRAEKVFHEVGFKDKNFYIIEKGRTNDEFAVVKIEGGRYVGFGYVEEAYFDSESIENCIRHYEDNRDTRFIIKGYMRKHPKLKIFKFESSDTLTLFS
ncbi:MAG: exonuclease domain-containing protein [Chloroflexota bacterium]|nr:exonuclease domain-containing protein [Lentimicrobium sp.]